MKSYKNYTNENKQYLIDIEYNNILNTFKAYIDFDFLNIKFCMFEDNRDFPKIYHNFETNCIIHYFNDEQYIATFDRKSQMCILNNNAWDFLWDKINDSKYHYEHYFVELLISIINDTFNSKYADYIVQFDVRYIVDYFKNRNY